VTPQEIADETQIVPDAGSESATGPEILNRNVYLWPEELTANEANDKARPNEPPATRVARVDAMMKSIEANGQELPVLVVEVVDGDTVTYEYIDGGCRVEARAKLNDAHPEDRKRVWCSLVDSTGDHYRTAVISNLHRTANSIIEMAHICQHVQERNGWKGRGAGQKVAEYLGLSNSRVSEFLKLLRAPKSVICRIESGELMSLDAALKAMSVPEEKRERVIDRAVEIAQEEREAAVPPVPAESAESAPPAVSAESTPPAVPANSGYAIASTETAEPTEPAEPLKPSKPAPPPKIKSRHVAQAIRETKASTASRNLGRSLTDVKTFWRAIMAPSAAVKFANYFAGSWIPGIGTDAKAAELLGAVFSKKAVTSQGDKAKAEPKPKSAPKPGAKPKPVSKAKPPAKSKPKPSAKQKK
jgi:hypothetical protein